jgi:uncharacterized protein YqeY
LGGSFETVLRERLSAALKDAAEAGEQRSVATLRLILAALRERDHCARETGSAQGLSDGEILAMLQDMVAQRRGEIARCESCAQVDLAQQEAEEISVIQQFLPPRMSEKEIAVAVDAAIRALGAAKLKDTGKVIAALKQQYNGQMDFACAKRFVCQRLH